MRAAVIFSPQWLLYIHMKNIFLGMLVVMLIGGGGFVWFRYGQPQSTPTTVQNAEESGSKTDTVSGLLLPGKGDDYRFVLRAENGKTIGIATQKIALEPYVNKKVEITGSYSGSTLYVYTIAEVQ